MVEAQNLSNEKQILSLIAIESLNDKHGVTAQNIIDWRNGSKSMSLEDVGRLTLVLLKQRKIFISKNNHHDVQTKAIRVKQLNAKISEDAEGVYGTLHEIIDEYIDVVHDFLK